jgi:hypothetical protein
MTNMTWHAYYFDTFDRSAPAARTAIIEAESEDDAGKLAIAQMGRALRVHVTRPLWGDQGHARLAAWRRAAAGAAGSTRAAIAGARLPD